MLGRGEGRRRLAPEVVQTSAMDCGPAALACLLRGFGVAADYGRLREACQTDVDGTSIDTLEDIAASLGLDAQQVMVPADTVLDPETDALPAIVVMRLPHGFTHFVVAWRRHGRWVQIMDPAVGRRFMSARRFTAETYRHAMPLPAEAWEGFARSDGFGRVLRGRLSRLGVPGDEVEALIAGAADADRRGVLDAAGRAVQALSRAGAIGRRSHGDALRAMLDRPELIPDGFRQAVPAASADEEAAVELRGAVLVRVAGRVDIPDAAALPPELAAAIGAPLPRPLRDLVARVAAAGRGRLAAATLGTVAAGAGVVVEALLFRHGFDLARGARPQAGVTAALLAVLAAIALLEWPVTRALFGLGRRAETRLRLDFLAKLPRLHDRYLQSRPVSDMAERSHNLHRIRLLPLVGGGLVRAVAELCFTAAALVWLVPAAALPTALLVLVALAVPLAFQPALNERDLRMRSHQGALGRLVLDALLGVVPVRAHGAGAAVAHEHGRLLDEWWRTGRAFQRAVAASEAISLAATLPLVAWLLVAHAPGGDPGRSLLFVYWAVALPVLGYEVGLFARQYAPMRNIVMRLVEPLGAPEEEEDRSSPSAVPAPAPGRPVGVELRNVTALAGGHPVLVDVDLDIPPGAHVAVVGASGAGKSTLLGLLLGWHRAAAGEVLIDGLPLRGDVLDGLRATTAWVDPAVQLWNRSLLDNLRYGAQAQLDVDAVIEAARLRGVVDALPIGVDSSLGEGGALVSGGEGQRVRLGRALHRPSARLVVLDEPFRGLDRPTRHALLTGARVRWATATLLCATHDVAETIGFDRVLVVDGGRVVEDGPPADLAAQAGSRYAALLAAEDAVRAALWDDPTWRRLRLDGGRVCETASEGRT